MSTLDTPTKTISDFEAKLDQADRSVAQFDRDDKTAIAKARGYLRDNPTMIPALRCWSYPCWPSASLRRGFLAWAP